MFVFLFKHILFYLIGGLHESHPGFLAWWLVQECISDIQVTAVGHVALPSISPSKLNMITFIHHNYHA